MPKGRQAQPVCRERYFGGGAIICPSPSIHVPLAGALA
jgi:hypothetical protein